MLLLTDAPAIQLRLFGEAAAMAGSRVHYIAQTLLLSVYARSVMRVVHGSLDARAAAGEIQEGLQLLDEGESFFVASETDIREGSILWDVLRSENPMIWTRIPEILREMAPPSAVRLRLAFQFAVDTDAERVRLATVLPLLFPVELHSGLMTLSNNLFHLQFNATRSARHDLIGSVQMVTGESASDALAAFALAKVHEGGESSELPFRPTREQLFRAHLAASNGDELEATERTDDPRVVVGVIGRLEILDNLVLFQYPDQWVRTVHGRALMRRVGAAPFSRSITPGWYTFPAAQVDALDYTTMRLPASVDPTEEWLNREVSVLTAIQRQTYADNVTRTHSGIRLIG
jgi:uncharacterized protein YjeT (DUF2065 family)